jgi:hypothetical protein
MIQFAVDHWREILDTISHVVFGLVLAATAIVRLTPCKADDEKLNKILSHLHLVFRYLPTLGVNPKTKELEQLMKKNDEPKA